VATKPVADDALAGHCGPIELSIKTGPLEYSGCCGPIWTPSLPYLI